MLVFPRGRCIRILVVVLVTYLRLKQKHSQQIIIMLSSLLSMFLTPVDILCRPELTHVGDEVQEGVAAQRADGQRHQEAEEELEENFVKEWDEEDPDQCQQADDGDRDKAADPRCDTQQ